MYIKRKDGIDIPVIINGEGNKIVILCHGFGGKKESSTNRLVGEEFQKQGYKVIAFDFTGQGERLDEGEEIRVKSCLEDLDTVIKYFSKEVEEISLFGSSFGGYMTLLYASRNNWNRGNIYLKSPALELSNVLWNMLGEKEKIIITSKGYGAIVHKNGNVTISLAFLDELKRIDIYEEFSKSNIKVKIVHGDADKTALYKCSKKLDHENEGRVELKPSVDGDHFMKRVVDKEAILSIIK
ncbi:MAG: alpha/beta hydrolase [Clostridia bacterium]|jgi:esterase/lipase|nr:alpha/beta hydrolase [Clostridia bacterium]